MIPKVINQIWIGKRIIKPEHFSYIQKWREMYPDFKHVFWDNDLVESTQIIPEDKNTEDNQPVACPVCGCGECSIGK